MRYQENKEEENARRRARYVLHRDRTLEQKRQYDAEHTEEKKEYFAEYYQEHVEFKKDYNRKYYDQHRQEFKVENAEYWASHGDEIKSRRVGNRLYEKKRKEAIFEKGQYQGSTGGGQPIPTQFRRPLNEVDNVTSKF